ncbi:MAG: hypothetical protein V4724_36730 [Pseudomonadota bacterium]
MPTRSTAGPDAAATLGVWILLASELMLFAPLLLAYAYCRLHYPDDFAAASRLTDFALGTLNTALLLTSSMTMALAVGSSRRGARSLLGATAALGLAFLALKGSEYRHDLAARAAPRRRHCAVAVAGGGRSRAVVRAPCRPCRPVLAFCRRTVDLYLSVAASGRARRGASMKLRRVLLVWAALLALTAVSASRPLGAWNGVASLAIATGKAALVAWFYMELREPLAAICIAASAGRAMLLLVLSAADYTTRAQWRALWQAPPARPSGLTATAETIAAIPGGPWHARSPPIPDRP